MPCKHLLSFLFTALTCISSFAENNCPDFDFREKLGPVRDQKDKGWCYAFAAADVATYHTGQLISATDIAIQHGMLHRTTPPDLRQGVSIKELIMSAFRKAPQTSANHEGGYGGIALQNSLVFGFCPESQMPSIDNDALKAGWFSEAFSQAERLHRFKFRPDDGLCPSGLRSAQSIFPGLNPTDLEAIIYESTSRNLLANVANHQCDRINIHSTHRPQNCTEGPCGGMLAQSFNADTGPVYFSLNMNSLLAGKDGLDGLTSFEEFNLQTPSWHAMTLVGQKWDGKSCKWIVKNSWGKACNQYSSRVSCDENGFLSIDKNYLAGQIRQTSWLQAR